MAESRTVAEQTEVFSWLKTLPLAPEYHPTLAEFQDPISYIFKIENEASKYGICKIVPPVPSNPKKTAIANLNRSLAARAGTAYSTKSAPPTFTTRQQQIGFCPRKPRPVRRPVWQSGEYYTFQQFEAKAKSFEKSYLKKCVKKVLSPLEIETMYWKANVDKPFSVEYANDMPGSAFAVVNTKKCREAGEGVTVGETAWNMRGVSRANGSLLRFMKEEVPGVTSPMVYVAMMFSWFAWHVEDHDLHSLNYMHMGGGKTWYGVPRDAAFAFEEVVRVHGYGGEINPLVTFATLGEKTTVMSPEVFIKAGIPCCRLVQNPGEFVVTFPRAYHSGFSHGFNCGEAANIATPEWLRVAKDAAIRRASINYPPMVSHIQLLYDLALSLSSRLPMSISAEPRSSRLKQKKKGEGEITVKELFVQNVVQNNDLLHNLGEGSSIVILPQSSLHISACSNLPVISQSKAQPKLYPGLCNQKETIKESGSLFSDGITVDKNNAVKQLKGYFSVKETSACLGETNRSSSLRGNGERDAATEGDSLSGKRVFSCATCGIVTYACTAIVQPSEAAARYLMSADSSLFNDMTIGSGESNEGVPIAKMNGISGRRMESNPDGLYDVPVQSSDYDIQGSHLGDDTVSDTEAHEGPTALGLLALTYGNSSDSDNDDQAEHDISDYDDRTNGGDRSSRSRYQYTSSLSPPNQDVDGGLSPTENIDSYGESRNINSNFGNRSYPLNDCALQFESDALASVETNISDCTFTDLLTNSNFSKPVLPHENDSMSFAQRSQDDPSRMHVFCLEHAVEVEQQLRPFGGAHILLLCHPDYPKVEDEAKLVAKELGFDHLWNDTSFREATREDEEWIQSALNSEEAVPGIGDWAVKLGINLYYSAIHSRLALYSKQMPYNSVIYNAFGCDTPAKSPSKPKVYYGKRPTRQKKIVLAGKWCGKVWMTNQVHPLLVPKEPDDQGDVGDRNFHGPCSDPDEMLQTKPETTCKTPIIKYYKKTERKRKIVPEDSRSIKKGKMEDFDRDGDGDGDNSAGDCPPQREFRSIKKTKYPDFEDHPVSERDDSPPPEDSLPRRRSKRTKEESPQPQKKIDKNFKKFGSYSDDDLEGGPSTRLRKRKTKPEKDPEPKPITKKLINGRKPKKTPSAAAYNGLKSKDEEVPKSKKIKDEEVHYYQCDLEGCEMSFASKQELAVHKRNTCPVCGKKLFSHKYLMQHRRVHNDDRPLKCPWKGCKMTFKWAWARTEHERVHTGARPYVCGETGCGQTFRFVSDFSRHKRKTGHSTKKKGRG